jgi:Spy/CpxP family protein refolding chaperone
MKKTAIIFFILLLAAPTLYAQHHRGPGFDDHRRGPRGPRHHHHRRGRLWGNPEALKYRFNLSDTQINKIKAINKKYHQKHVQRRDKMYYLRRTLRSIILAPEIDKAKLRSILKKISALEADLRYYKIMHRYEIEKVLTPEQRRMVRDERRRHRRYRHRR